MQVDSSAVGIASLGIQICQGLLSYYDAWRSYDSDVSNAYDAIDDLSRTLALLKASLDSDELDDKKKDRVKMQVLLRTTAMPRDMYITCDRETRDAEESKEI